MLIISNFSPLLKIVNEKIKIFKYKRFFLKKLFILDFFVLFLKIFLMLFHNFFKK